MPSDPYKLNTVAEPVDVVDTYRMDATRRLDPETRSKLGQFLTPAPIAVFMASLFSEASFGRLKKSGQRVHLLDAGAGIGTLTSAFADRVSALPDPPEHVRATLYEIDPVLQEYLEVTLQDGASILGSNQIAFDYDIVTKDFIEEATKALGGGQLFAQPATFTHAILNPPYKKIQSSSRHRHLLRAAGIETSNLYTGFLALAILLLAPEGELVAIVPRSFCNGPYFKPFRALLLAHTRIKHLHVFESRTDAFKDDEVLQENVILHLVKTKRSFPVTITSSSGADFSDVTRVERALDQVVDPQDENCFLHITTNHLDQHVIDRMRVFSHSLDDLGLTVSTGPVVDFRLKNHLRKNPDAGTVPLLYPAHFDKGFISWPSQNGKKPNAIVRNEETERWLFPAGVYTVVRRFSSKEEPRRIVAAIFDPSDRQDEVVGFENHLNVFHAHRAGLAPELAKGLAVYLNSTLVDAYFRQFNGHTQVNATDLRTLPYPDKETLIQLGVAIGGTFPDQHTIDHLLENILLDMADLSGTNPVAAQKKIEDAISILQALDFPKAQQNERSALALLALLDLKPEDDWGDATDPLMGITPIMHFCRDQYGRQYAPNTRETFRKDTVHQFVDAGLVVPNPDQSDRPINSPRWCYQVEAEALELLKSYGTSNWEANLATYLKDVETLKERYARARSMEMVPVRMTNGRDVNLSAGEHSELIKAIVEEFAPRFTPDGQVLYLGETGAKFTHFDQEALRKLGVEIDTHGKMPDVVIYLPDKNWLVLVEAVTSRGPVDGKRRDELQQLFSDSNAGLVYVTAFPSRTEMRKYLSDISWETEVWVASAPSHLIHFNGTRFLGPYS